MTSLNDRVTKVSAISAPPAPVTVTAAAPVPAPTAKAQVESEIDADIEVVSDTFTQTYEGVW